MSGDRYNPFASPSTPAATSASSVAAARLASVGNSSNAAVSGTTVAAGGAPSPSASTTSGGGSLSSLANALRPPLQHAQQHGGQPAGRLGNTDSARCVGSGQNRSSSNNSSRGGSSGRVQQQPRPLTQLDATMTFAPWVPPSARHSVPVVESGTCGCRPSRRRAQPIASPYATATASFSFSWLTRRRRAAPPFTYDDAGTASPQASTVAAAPPPSSPSAAARSHHPQQQQHRAGPYDVAHYRPPWTQDCDPINASPDELDGTLRGAVPMFRDVEAFVRSPLGHRVLGALSATTYALTFRLPAGASLPPSMRHLPASYFSVPVGSIKRVERVVVGRAEAGGSGGGGSGGGGSASFLLEIHCKDTRILTLGFRDEATAEKMAGHIKVIAFPTKTEFMHAFAEPPPSVAAASSPVQRAPSASQLVPLDITAPSPAAMPSSTLTPFPGWDLYSPYRELDRLGVLSLKHPSTEEPLFRVTDVNREYEYAPTYPAVLVVPERTSDDALASISSFRSKARIPALTWMHPVWRCTMWRSSQPRVGMGNATNAADEALCAAIRAANVYSRDPAAPLLIIDCRPRANAMANKAGGWGYESYGGCTLEFCGMNNIHALRDSYKKLETLCLNSSPADVNWSAAVADCGWHYHVRTMLSASLFTAEAMHRRGQSVLVHCSDGWDRTAQVCGMVQVLLDPYARTVRGFCSLIAKEWCSFGHKFHERAGHALEKHDDSDISPVFLQWLDGVWQLVRLFPAAFEFGPRLPLLLAHHLYSCRFGTFLYNCERERAINGLQFRSPSLWAHVVSSAPKLGLLNPRYDPGAGDVLLPHPASVLRCVALWDDWFTRFSPFPSTAPCCAGLERYPAAAYDHARVRAAVVPRAPAPAAAGEGAAAAPVSVGAASAAGSGGPQSPSPAAAASGVDSSSASGSSARPTLVAAAHGLPSPSAGLSPSPALGQARQSSDSSASSDSSSPAAVDIDAQGLADEGLDAEDGGGAAAAGGAAASFLPATDAPGDDTGTDTEDSDED